jgi:hypothetical protein
MRLLIALFATPVARGNKAMTVKTTTRKTALAIANSTFLGNLVSALGIYFLCEEAYGTMLNITIAP